VLLKIAVFLLVWFGSMRAVLEIANLNLGLKHSVCGPWGCGPRTEALIAVHGFWMVLLLPPLYWLARRTPPAWLHWIGACFLALGALALAGIGGWAWHDSLHALPEKLLLHGYLFAVVTAVEIPAVQVLLAGAMCLLTARVRIRKQNNALRAGGESAGDEMAAAEEHATAAST